jgi:hypothetical protein
MIAVYRGSPAIAHMMVSFNFGADDLDISIERRDEIGESSPRQRAVQAIRAVLRGGR